MEGEARFWGFGLFPWSCWVDVVEHFFYGAQVVECLSLKVVDGHLADVIEDPSDDKSTLSTNPHRE